ncbi:MAG TPA: hypothetical protein VF520_02845 [Thermoleophilaceae bacterium]
MARLGRLAATVAALALAAPASASAEPAPGPEPNGAAEVTSRPCAYEGGDRFEERTYRVEGWKGPEYDRYPGICRRLRYSYGPILVKPGQNEVLNEPVTIQKPEVDGYITRFRPNLVRSDGSVPPQETVHLHHMALLSLSRRYGNPSAYADVGLPPFAAGEEKTLILFPRGYGLPVRGSDVWGIFYMVHSAMTQPVEVYITYDIDFVPQAEGDAAGMKPVYPVWVDTRPQDPVYAVHNSLRGYGGPDGKCTWPREKCAEADPWGRRFVGQGEPGNGTGSDYRLPARGESLGAIDDFEGGTLVFAGSHIHPGGLENSLDLVRPGRTEVVRRRTKRGRVKRVRRVRDAVRIHTGTAEYWDRAKPARTGGPPNSWDFSVEVSTLPAWGVHVEPGDVLRANVTYDTSRQSHYENMGGILTFLSPDDDRGRPTAPGVDPFAVPRDRSETCRSRGLRARRRPQLCDKGYVTHGHLKENDNFGGPEGGWDAPRGDPTDRVGIADFVYLPGDLSMVSMTGVPTVKLGSSLTFDNLDSHTILHTATSCDFPCKGPTGTAYPQPNGSTSTGRRIDFDSGSLGFGSPFGPAKQTPEWDLKVTPEQGFAPGEIVTYYCRVHPSMRGAFEVTR